MPNTIHAWAIEAAGRHMRRAMAAVRLDLNRGLNGVAATVTIVPLLGFAGTCLGIVNSFRGVHGEKSAALAALNWSLAESLAPAALGLLLAIPALWWHRYLTGRVDTVTTEMEAESLGLLNSLPAPGNIQ